MVDQIMNHIREGVGNPPIVFVHGYLCELENWRHQVDHFQATTTVLACDLRGLGKTPLGNGEMTIEQMGQDVAALLAHHDLTNAVLVGHSMGGPVALEAARLLKGRVDMVIGADTLGDVSLRYPMSNSRGCAPPWTLISPARWKAWCAVVSSYPHQIPR